MMCTPHKKLEGTIYWAFTHIKNSESLQMVNIGYTVYVLDYQIWHKCLGHMTGKALTKLPQCTENFPSQILKRKSTPSCPGCAEGKMTSKSFSESKTRAENIFELIHCDLKTLPVLSYHKYKYFFVFVDN